MLRLLYVLVLAYAVSACGDATTTHNHDHAGHEHHDHSDHAGHDHPSPNTNITQFGAKFDAQGGLTAQDVIAKVEAGEETTDLDLGEDNIVKAVPTKLEGTVSDVCVKAGCWLKVAANGQEIFISTDHKFSVPKDIVGKTVVVDGHAYMTEQSVEELRHYEEDAGATPEQLAAITEPKTTYTVLARGVVIK